MGSIHRKFALIGAAGYIAPRHLSAMRSSGCDLVAAHDLSDSVGILDRYFPEARFTADPADFERRLKTDPVDYLTVCTPNHLHCAHALMGLEAGADVICEKPLALGLDQLERMEACQRATGRRIHPILQLRLHPEIIRLKESVEEGDPATMHDIDLTYITPRGPWYAASWKGDPTRSGGLAANIGIHFIDMLHWIFGPAERVVLHHAAPDCTAGFLQLRRARVRYFLSVNPRHRPAAQSDPMTPCRHLVIDGSDFDFSAGFTDLHTLSYRRILAGEGFSTDDARPAVATLETLRHAVATGAADDCHPLVRNL